ncbi:L-threonylcarbamoyladenylate synthase [Ruania albidiflava]|uniref:L-threonylcarbamoyladenylate synthase n=1 Tax=Ruania albidiflava TaxID=366586 RepID=UPI0030B8DBD0
MPDLELLDCRDAAVRADHLAEAVRQLAEGRLVVLPTDTVYGIAADAFTPRAVTALLTAKGRSRQMPPPVLIGDALTLDGLATDVPDAVRDLVEEFWPGPLTVILHAHGSLRWDLGDTHGTVALRMPDEEITLELLRRTGPLAVSSANRSGEAPALTCADAAAQLGRSVRVYLDGGTVSGGVASTIVDATGDQLRIVREGALTATELGSIAPELLPVHVPETVEEPAQDQAGDTETEDPGAEQSPVSDAVAEQPETAASSPDTASDAVAEQSSQQSDDSPGGRLP